MPSAPGRQKGCITCLAVTEWKGLASSRNTCQRAVTLSQAGDTLSGPYFNITGCTGAPARKAPVLNGSRHLPFEVVPCKRRRVPQRQLGPHLLTKLDARLA